MESKKVFPPPQFLHKGERKGFDVNCPNQRIPGAQKKQATSHDLQKINFVLKDGTYPNLSNKASAVLALCVALVRLEYCGISAFVAEIVKSIDRCGYHMSDRTFYRACAELESQGFFNRLKYRVGPDKFATILVFDLKRFEFFKRKNEVPKKPTSSHISPCLPNWQEEVVTSTTSRVNSSNSSSKVNNKPRARASRFKNWIHPVLYSIMIVLQRAKDRDRSFLISRARFEIDCERQNLEIPGHSGVEWNRPSWQDMPHRQREQIINAEILPALRDKSNLVAQNEVSEFISAVFSPPKEIREVVHREVVQEPVKRPVIPSELNLSPHELEILRAAANRAASRNIA